MSIAGSVPAQPQADSSSENVEFARPAKRTRVAVACVRCKSRKQKCDGGQPTCGNCKHLSIACEYIVPSKSIPHGKYQYIKALEARVAELEGVVSSAGLTDSGKETWNHPTNSSDRSVILDNESVTSKQQHEGSSITEATQYLKDLSLHAGGGFVGDESSNITVGHIFGTFSQIDSPKTNQHHPTLNLRSQSDGESSNLDPEFNPLAEVTSETAELLLNGYLKHISTRWVVLYRVHVLELHKKNSRETLKTPFDISTLNLVYAIGGRFLETVGEVGIFTPDRFYQAALDQLNTILQAADIAAVQTLLLHAIYCLRAPRGLSAWTNVGLATRICVSLGLHRKTTKSKPSLVNEVKKRVFWSCYCLDRQVSIILGRPFAISDRDIDAELPLDVPDTLGDADIQAIPNPDPDKPSNPSTSLSCFIHICRLRRIESQIQQSIYRVDRNKPLSRAKLDAILVSLEQWRSQLPPTFAESDTKTYSYDGIWYYDVYYYKCLRLLLFPHLSVPGVDPDIIVKCADACGGVCRSYKWLHRETKVGFSLMAIYTIFLAGLNLLYCLWMMPATIYTTTTMNDLNSCSIVLYVIAERWPGAIRYRDAFETIKQNVLGLLEKGQESGNRLPLPGLASRGLREIGTQGLYPEAGREYSQMMNEMAGSSRISPASRPSTGLARAARSLSTSSQTTADNDSVTVPTTSEQQFSFGYSPQMYAGQPYFYEGQPEMQHSYQHQSMRGLAGPAENLSSVGYGYSGLIMPTNAYPQFAPNDNQNVNAGLSGSLDLGSFLNQGDTMHSVNSTSNPHNDNPSWGSSQQQR